MPRFTAFCCALALCGGTTLPGRDFPRTPSSAPAEPPNPALLQPFTAAERAHGAESGFRLYPVGVDGLLPRLELIQAAHSSPYAEYACAS